MESTAGGRESAYDAMSVFEKISIVPGVSAGFARSLGWVSLNTKELEGGGRP